MAAGARLNRPGLRRDSFTDALTAAPVCGKQNSVLVLVDPRGGYTAFDAVYDRNRVVHGHVLGGASAISDASWAYFTSS